MVIRALTGITYFGIAMLLLMVSDLSSILDPTVEKVLLLAIVAGRELLDLLFGYLLLALAYLRFIRKDWKAHEKNMATKPTSAIPHDILLTRIESLIAEAARLSVRSTQENLRLKKISIERLRSTRLYSDLGR